MDMIAVRLGTRQGLTVALRGTSCPKHCVTAAADPLQHDDLGRHISRRASRPDPSGPAPPSGSYLRRGRAGALAGLGYGTFCVRRWCRNEFYTGIGVALSLLKRTVLIARGRRSLSKHLIDSVTKLVAKIHQRQPDGDAIKSNSWMQRVWYMYCPKFKSNLWEYCLLCTSWFQHIAHLQALFLDLLLRRWSGPNGKPKLIWGRSSVVQSLKAYDVMHIIC